MVGYMYLQKFEANIKRLRCRYERMELLKRGSRRPARRSLHSKARTWSFSTGAEDT